VLKLTAQVINKATEAALSATLWALVLVSIATWLPATSQTEDSIRLLTQIPEGEAAYRKVVQSVNALPDETRRQLFSTGLKIVVVSSLVEYNPSLQEQTPAGYKEGEGYNHMDAQFRGRQNEIVVGVRVARKTEKMVINNRVGSATLHELGHAYDRYAHFPSQQDSFRRHYQSDSHALSPSSRNRDHYYLQPGANGRRELFAELFLYCFHQRAHLNARHRHLVEDFPRCYHFVYDLTNRRQ
jgi:hypothetical protein